MYASPSTSAADPIDAILASIAPSPEPELALDTIDLIYESCPELDEPEQAAVDAKPRAWDDPEYRRRFAMSGLDRHIEDLSKLPRDDALRRASSPDAVEGLWNLWRTEDRLAELVGRHPMVADFTRAQQLELTNHPHWSPKNVVFYNFPKMVSFGDLLAGSPFEAASVSNFKHERRACPIVLRQHASNQVTIVDPDGNLLNIDGCYARYDR